MSSEASQCGVMTRTAETLTEVVNKVLTKPEVAGRTDDPQWVYAWVLMRVMVDMGINLKVPPSVGLQLAHKAVEVLAQDMLMDLLQRGRGG